MRKIFLIPIIFLAACSAQSTPQVTPTITPLPFATATLPFTLTPRPSATAGIPTPVPTIAPITASLTSQINVRVAPDKNATSLGLLNYGQKVQIIGKDASGKWWKIIYPENSVTTGWVSAEYAPVSESDVKKIPVSQTSDLPAQPTAAPIASNATNVPVVANATPTSDARTAKVKAQIFVRKGPGQMFDTLGTVNAGAVVTITGRNENNVWVQILYEGGADGKAWVAAAYLDGANLQGLPMFDNQGNLIYSPTPGAVNPGQPSATATSFSAAALDGDSEQNPGVRLKFSPDSAGKLTFSSDLSSPNGDSTDWVAFTPYEPTNQSTYVYLKLECRGNGGITAILEKDGIPVPERKPLVCGNYGLAMQVLGGQEYMLVLSADGSGGMLRYVHYTLYIDSQP